MSGYLCGCQEGKQKEDCSKHYNLWSSLTLQQRIDRHREVQHEETQQVLCGHQPRLSAELKEKDTQGSKKKSTQMKSST